MRTLQQFTGITLQGSLYALLFLLPFSNAAIEIAFGFMLLAWVLERLNRNTRRESVWGSRQLRPLVWTIGAYLGVCALSIAVSDYPSLSIRGFVTKWLEYLAFCIIVADIGCRPRIVTRAITVLAWSSLLVVVEAILQELTGKGPLRGYPFMVHETITGPYKNPIDLATYLMVIIPVLIVYARHVSHIARRWLWCLIALLTGCLFRTEAQGPLIGFVIGLGSLYWFAPYLRRSLAVFVTIAGGLGVARLLVTGGLVRVVSVVDTGAVDRSFMWQAGWGMFMDRPILGHGLNTFMANYLSYWVGGEYMPRYAHNCYLQVAAETGVKNWNCEDEYRNRQDAEKLCRVVPAAKKCQRRQT